MNNLTFFFFLIAISNLSALDVNLWQHSEIAGKNTVFIDAGFPIPLRNPEFNILPVIIRIDYMLPFPLPVSAGVFMITPDPNLKHFGFRLGYHFDLLKPSTDFYLLYSFNIGFIRNDALIEHNDTPVKANCYDFRLGVRYFFGSLFGLTVETGFKLESIIILLSLKIN
jgi:hypothetical protein